MVHFPSMLSVWTTQIIEENGYSVYLIQKSCSLLTSEYMIQLYV